jgi:cell division protein FtsB
MSFLAKTWKFIKPVFLNKYLIVLLGFAVFITFFDQHNLIQRWETYRKIRQLEKEYKYYQDEITNDKLEMQKLQNDDQYLEKFAREHYHLKNKDEEIFIIKD